MDDPPTAISLSDDRVANKPRVGVVVGTLAVTDPDLGDTTSFALLDDAGGRFAIEGNRLVVLDGTRISYLQSSSHDIMVRATDANGASVDVPLTVEVSNVYNITQLDGSIAVHLVAGLAFEIPLQFRLGESLARAGDLNGDGLSEVITSVSESHIRPTFPAVLLGQSEAFPDVIPLDGLDGSNGFRISGAAGVVGGGGDMNGDGLSDIVVETATGAPVLFGSEAGFPAAWDLDGAAGFRIEGTSSPLGDVAVDGDLNGDRLADVVLGVPEEAGSRGAAFVVFGRANGNPSPTNAGSLDEPTGYRIDGAAPEDALGSSVSAGDINGDGFADLIVGAPGADPNGIQSAGSCFVVFGREDSTSPIDLTSLDGSNGFRIDGATPDGRLGEAVGYAGDINGDGFDDLIVGAPGANRA